MREFCSIQTKISADAQSNIGQLFTWNVNGIQDNNVGNEKARFLKHKIHELRDVEICLLTETHKKVKKKYLRNSLIWESLII